jgi:prolyl oligopeptidase
MRNDFKLKRSSTVTRARKISCALTVASCITLSATHAEQPVAAIKPVVDTYFGTTVTDPYRYMEDPNSSEVQQWASAQSDHARAVLDAIPGRKKLFTRIAELEASVQQRVTDVTRLPGEVYFYEKRGADDNQFKLFVRRGLTGAEKLLVDPELLAKTSGKPHALTFYEPSESGKLVAYGMSEGGSEEASIHVLDVATLKEVIEPIDRAHYSHARWMPDDSGFFYLRQRVPAKDAPETEKYRFQTAYFHRMNGTGSDQDIIEAGVTTSIEIAPEEFPLVFPAPETPYVVAIPRNGVQREIAVYVAERADVLMPKVKWRKLFGREDDVTSFAIHGNDLYVLTHKDAPRFKILKTNVVHPDLAHAEVVIAPSREVVTHLAAAKNALYVLSRNGLTGKLRRVAYGVGAKPELVRLPREGALALESSDPRLPGAIISIGSWTHDFGYFVADVEKNHVEDTGLQAVGPYGAPEGLIAKEVLVKSFDGIEVPLSIVYPKAIKLDGSNPTHLYGYGSYGITDDPFYIPRLLAWYELGGIRATCHVRGGGAYGEEWHLAGKLGTKTNTWKDFIVCAEYLIKEGYTSTSKLAIHGGSAGGILIGRAMTQRPDLFAVAVPEVGVLNVLRSETSANGVPNIPEFGTVKDENQFHYLLEMDAYQHVQDGIKYPATLLVHGINDPRVPVWESNKMAARLQAASTSGKPILLRLDYEAGHGIGSTKTQRQEVYADIWSFMLWQFGDVKFQPAR